MVNGGNTVPRIEKSEHIGPDDTGDNIQAKRVAPYGFGTNASWSRLPAPFIDVAYDAVAFSNPDANGNYQTIVFNAASVAQRTLSLTFDASNNVTSIARS